MLNGKHLLAGNWVRSEETFTSSPAEGEAFSFSVGTAAGAHNNDSSIAAVMSSQTGDFPIAGKLYRCISVGLCLEGFTARPPEKSRQFQFLLSHSESQQGSSQPQQMRWRQPG